MGPGSPGAVVASPYGTTPVNGAGGGHLRKPPYSYSTLISFAINSSPTKKMTLADIYNWICLNFPFYKEAGSGWKVSDGKQADQALCEDLHFIVLIFVLQRTPNDRSRS